MSSSYPPGSGDPDQGTGPDYSGTGPGYPGAGSGYPGAGGYSSPGYPAPGGYGGPGNVMRQDHPKATLSLVLGIVALVLCQILGPFAWTIGGRAVKDIDASAGRLGGRGQAQAGRILGIIATVLLILGILFAIAVIVGLLNADWNIETNT